ncbi:MAG: hypothetical protein OEZ01_07560 [Candidatus Heimdallarchaeota archaeon]|nr:hypothetical protein [Candidatus Heimdallarchaeota archaeon]MDH5645848.1 hypothetical protein [Candidatus Heimdallarchaeota archaeon]
MIKNPDFPINTDKKMNMIPRPEKKHLMVSLIILFTLATILPSAFNAFSEIDPAIEQTHIVSMLVEDTNFTIFFDIEIFDEDELLLTISQSNGKNEILNATLYFGSVKLDYFEYKTYDFIIDESSYFSTRFPIDKDKNKHAFYFEAHPVGYTNEKYINSGYGPLASNVFVNAVLWGYGIWLISILYVFLKMKETFEQQQLLFSSDNIEKIQSSKHSNLVFISGSVLIIFIFTLMNYYQDFSFFIEFFAGLSAWFFIPFGLYLLFYQIIIENNNKRGYSPGYIYTSVSATFAYGHLFFLEANNLSHTHQIFRNNNFSSFLAILTFVLIIFGVQYIWEIYNDYKREKQLKNIINGNLIILICFTLIFFVYFFILITLYVVFP